MFTKYEFKRDFQLLGKRQHSSGFSLFELVVFIISVAIIYASAARRFAEFPGEAERVNFLAITIELQTAVNLEIMMGYSLGKFANVEAFAGTNPMDLMLSPPSNYLGALEFVDQSQLPRRSWYFDRQSEELVYLINDNDNVSVIRQGVKSSTDEIRFRIQLEYRLEDIESGLPIELVENGNLISEDNIRRRLNGVTMKPTVPFNWGGVDANALAEDAIVEASG
ncbi:MAG: hypothetical protein COA96_11000 [SAR86 cluster bacterium]|uniref:Type II secretion system protein n=1 Tax=SAR86 cluster bacterium TaxID=2030880 RepID=A0A2A5AXE9_9GAMM|nr:MAG: hypothetical protein COA96_11000 [SAR86 cluster bacterium]